ncbi:MAG TPA: hypothetical protein VLA75_08525, partial [Thermoanaerobaculia bacterium]|nr:hypothetical protein [Thermoanaerobaculia bacterium]
MRELLRRDAGRDRAGPGLPGRLVWALLLLSPAALLLPPLARLAAAVVLLGAGWRLRRVSRRDGRIAVAGFGLLLSLALACLAPGLRGIAGGDPARDPESLETAWSSEWQRLAAAVDRTAAELGPAGRDAESRARSFRLLAREAAREPRFHLALLDPDGAAVAWAGGGLVPDLRPRELPDAGRVVRTSFGAIALVEVRAVPGEGGSPWRLLAARPVPLDRQGLPAEPIGGRRVGLRPVFPSADEPVPEGWFALRSEGFPPVLFDPGRPAETAAGRGERSRCERALPFVLALTLLAIAVSRGAGRLLLQGTVFA